jgi:hypothetical protein
MAVSSLLAITGWFAYTLIHEIQLYDWLAKPVNPANMPLLAGFPQNLQQFGNQTIRYYYEYRRIPALCNGRVCFRSAIEHGEGGAGPQKDPHYKAHHEPWVCSYNSK